MSKLSSDLEETMKDTEVVICEIEEEEDMQVASEMESMKTSPL